MAFPTETVYGLGADGLNPMAVAKIFQVKGRPQDNPLILHVSGREQVERIAECPENAMALMETFWPGPLTIVLRAKPIVPEIVRAGLPSVGVRMPDHPVALDLIRAANRPLAAPSANRSGKPSPTSAAHVWQDLGGRIAGIIDGGPARIGIESTVVDLSVDPPLVLRPGAISSDRLQRELRGKLNVWRSSGAPEGQPSPGLRYRHYAPEAKLDWLQEEGAEHIARALSLDGERHGYLAHGFASRTLNENMLQLAAEYPQKLVFIPLGDTMEEIAAGLYQALRESDRLQLDRLWVARLPEVGMGRAIMDRLQRAMFKQ